MNFYKSPEIPDSGNALESQAPRPRNLTFAVRIMWVIWAFGSLYLLGVYVRAWMVGGFENINRDVSLMLGLGYVMVIMLWGMLVRAVSRGKNWARYVYGAIALLALLILLLSLFAPDKTILRYAVNTPLATAYLVVLWLLFRPTSAQWFKS